MLLMPGYADMPLLMLRLQLLRCCCHVTLFHTLACRVDASALRGGLPRLHA